jgi:DsbC/DsbD-like thiol-disulfide interchange protein
MKRFLITLLLFIFSTSIAIGSGLKKVEIVEGWEKSDGSIVHGLRISLHEGWKTYWHTPGPLGLKPQFDFEGSLNIGGLNILWPSPNVFGLSGFETIGYENEVIIPIAIKAEVGSDPVNLKIKGSLGICYDVCIPVEFKTETGLKIMSKDINTDLLAALANLPLSPSDLGKKNASCSMIFGPTGFKIMADIPYLEKADTYILFSIENYRNILSIEQPKLIVPGKIVSASGEWYGKPHPDISSDLITITHLEKGQVIEQKGC